MNEMTRIAHAPVDTYKARFTTAEFVRMCEHEAFEDWKIELVDGELERMPPPQRDHSFLQSALLVQLLAIFGAQRVFVELGVDLGSDTVFGCDVVVLREPLTENRWPNAHELLLAIEVSKSTLGRDLGMKAVRYAAADVPHYWVVDGNARVVHTYHDPVGATYARSETVRFGEPASVPGTDATITLS